MTIPAGSHAPPTLPTAVPPRPSRLNVGTAYRLLVVTVLGFASGLPLALTGQAMQAWLSVDGIDIATIGKTPGHLTLGPTLSKNPRLPSRFPGFVVSRAP